MIYVKKFIEKVSLSESKSNKDIVLPMMEARGLRDELAKLLADYNNLLQKPVEEPVITVQMKGGSF